MTKVTIKLVKWDALNNIRTSLRYPPPISDKIRPEIANELPCLVLLVINVNFDWIDNNTREIFHVTQRTLLFRTFIIRCS